MVVYSIFFNGKLTLKEALALSAPGIITLFQTFAASANANADNPYGVQDDALPYIESAVTMVETIHKRYMSEKPGPERNPGYIEDPTARPIRVGGLRVGYQGNEFELRNLYDIIGWIFSVVGDVPDGATRENYYYALIMIAHAFSTKLVPDTTVKLNNGTSRKVSCKAPELWMVMWFKQMVNNRPVTRVVLGATLDKPPQNVKDDTKDFRKNLLKEAGILVWKDGTPIPMQIWVAKGIQGQEFGHCGETYPLLFACSLAEDRAEAFEIRKSAEGISAMPLTLYNTSTSTITPYRNADGGVNPKVLPPCRNCMYLLAGNGFKVTSFEEELTSYLDTPLR